MPTTINGTTGVSQVQDGTVTNSALASNAVDSNKIANGGVARADLDPTNLLLQCKIWCRWDGTLTGTNPPTAGYGVTSVTRNSTGDYTINFSSSMADANYAWSGSAWNSSNNNTIMQSNLAGTQTTSALRVFTAASGSLVDAGRASVIIFGN